MVGTAVSCGDVGWLSVGRLKVQFALDTWCRCGPGNEVAVGRVEWRVSEQGDGSVIRGEGFSEDRAASNQGWAGFPVLARLCVANDDVCGANVVRL